ncbi:MAG: hypothetical protein K9M57_04430 [Phycisphaerae bacterium]|nr:hypothetical protein [Phycisphaerae bacterium]
MTYYYIAIGVTAGFIFILMGYRIFRVFQPPTVGLDRMARLTDQAAEAVYRRVQREYGQAGDDQEDTNNLLARAVCDELFGRVKDSQRDEDFRQRYRALIDEKLREIKDDADICKVVSQAAHIMGMVKYATSASGRPDDQYRSFEYKSVSLSRLNELGIETARFMPRGKSLFEHSKAFKAMVRTFDSCR